MEKVRKQTVLKEVREKGEWKGYIAPCKVNLGNINAGWHLGMQILIKQNELGDYHTLDEDGFRNTLDNLISAFEYFNCNNELGNKAAFYK